MLTIVTTIRKQIVFGVRNYYKINSLVRVISTSPLFLQKIKQDKYSKAKLTTFKSHLSIEDSSLSSPLYASYFWLRDHCRCNTCYNNATYQRSCDLLSIPFDIEPEKCTIDTDILSVTWKDGHESKYSLSWLWKNGYLEYSDKLNRIKPVLWKKNDIKIQHVEMDHYMRSDIGVRQLMTSLLEYGVGIVKNVPVSVAATEEVVSRIGHVQRTLFGDMWEFTSNMARSDTAYTNIALGAHTDGTYLNEASGLQVFHCLSHDGDGGETLLVDGFQAAETLKRLNIESYKFLCNSPIVSEYIEEGKHYSTNQPLLITDPVNGELEQIRFNIYDRAVMNMDPDLSTQIYSNLYSLASIIQNPEGEFWIKLKPGIVLLIDNWRVMHGRAAFSGSRHIAGCYVGRSEFLSCARVLGLRR